MTFLNPLVLFGLAAAAIPLILHLLSLRKLRTIEFSTLTFLKELQQTRIRRLKLRQILLLIVRTLLIILIVLAFARPALRGTILGTLGEHAHSTVVFILDDSFSMTLSDENGERFKQAKDAARNVSQLLKDGDEAFLIKLSDLPNATTEPALHDFHTLETLIAESDISQIRRPMEDALRLSARLLAQSKNVNKEVYIISDMQKTVFESRLQDTKSEQPSLFDDRAKFFVIPIGSVTLPNAGVDSVRVESSILEKEKPVRVRAWVRNSSPTPIRDYIVSAYLDSTKAAQKTVSAEPYSTTAVEFTVTPKRSGFVSGHIELEHDALEEDNRRYFSFFIPNRLSVAFVTHTPSDSKFPLLALHAQDEGNQQSFLNIIQTTVQQFPLLDLKNVDVLMCVAVSSYTANDVQHVKQFVENGGGLILFPESDFQQQGTPPLLSALRIPPVGAVTTTQGQSGTMLFDKIDADHPLFSTIFEEDSRQKSRVLQPVESPSISRMLQRQAGKEAHTIITTGGGPFLSEHSLGNGKILFYSASPVLTWSDFPLKGIFAPLIYRSVLYTASHQEESTSYVTGELPVITLRNRTSSATSNQFKLIGPDGIEELLHPTSSTSAQTGFSPPLVAQLPQLKTLGTYRIAEGPAIRQMFSVNVDHAESDTRLLATDELGQFWHSLGISPSSVRIIPKGDQVQPAILQSRFGVELWRYCIGLALLLALLEMLIARDSRKAMEPAAA